MRTLNASSQPSMLPSPLEVAPILPDFHPHDPKHTVAYTQEHARTYFNPGQVAQFVPRATSYSAKLLGIVLTTPHLRQPLLEQLGAFEIALLLDAARLQGQLGDKESEEYINPIRDLFTDREIRQFQGLLAGTPDHRLVFYGPDLITLFARVQK
jgi:hypothetical protein